MSVVISENISSNISRDASVNTVDGIADSATRNTPSTYMSSSKKQVKKASKHQHTVLIVEDDPGLREALEDTLTLANYDIVSAKNAEQAIELLSQQSHIHMVLSDINMGNLSGHDLLKHVTQFHAHIPVLLMTAYGSIKDSVGAIRNGAVDYLVKPFEPKELVNIVDRHLSGKLCPNDDTPIVADESSLQLLQLAQRVAQSDSTVLIAGESGTGKEVLARYIHQQSTRVDKPFIAINCAAIPENMLEAMLFGYEKGAYTGAHTTTPGKFEQANGGTLLLDEISEMDIGLQAKLLRVLQEQEVERLGGRKIIKLDVRIIATSNRNMSQYVTEGKFREDLYYRLSVLPLVWKPLRERTADILPLAEKLLEKHSRKQKRGSKTTLKFSPEAKNALTNHPWRGNVRELDNVIQRALILQTGTRIEANDLGLTLLSDMASQSFSPQVSCSDSSRGMNGEVASATEIPCFSNDSTFGSNASDDDSLGRVAIDNSKLGDNLQKKEFEIIAQTLEEEKGSRKNTADRLDISPRTLRYKLAKMREMGLLN